jgi:CRISPR-associated exonuclease Cas4
VLDDDFLPLSGVQHLLFCERQCALIHVDGVFAENALTAEGRLLHDSVSEPGARVREGVRVETDVWLRSERLRLVGRADRVETWLDAGVRQVRPVESKRARRKSLRADCVQLCAQAMALEEMRAVSIPSAELYYVNSRKRLNVTLGPDLREATVQAARRFHDIVRYRVTPLARQDARCPSCSLKDLCLPGLFQAGGRIERYLAAAWSDSDPL